jgi:hypothetical protein
MLISASRLLLIAAVVTTVLAAGCKKEDKPAPKGEHKSAPNPQATNAERTPMPEQGTQPAALAKPDFTLSADALTKEYAEGKEATIKKYKGKVLELTGAIDSANMNPIGRDPRLTVTGFKAPHFLDCRFKPSYEKKLKNTTKGQKIKLQGAWGQDFGPAIVFFDCDLLELGEDPAITVSAVELTQSYSKDKEATEKKYKEKQLVVEGVIVDIKLEAGKGVRNAFLKGFDDKAAKPVRVNAGFGYEHEDELKKLKVGQTIKVKGEFRGEFNGDVWLNDVSLVE